MLFLATTLTRILKNVETHPRKPSLFSFSHPADADQAFGCESMFDFHDVFGGKVRQKKLMDSDALLVKMGSGAIQQERRLTAKHSDDAAAQFDK